MKYIHRITNIALIFTLIGVFLCQDLYALRVPMEGYKAAKDVLHRKTAENLEIQEILQEIDLRRSLLQEHGRLGTGIQFRGQTRIIDYISRLELLSCMDVFKGKVLYPSMGTDFFPSYFAKTFGINIEKTDIGEKGTGIGVTGQKDIPELEEEALVEGLPERYKNKPKQYRIFTANNFDHEAYFPEVLKEGGVDVLFIKGLTRWISYYKSFPGGEFFKNLDWEFKKKLRSSIKDLIFKIDEELIKEGGFIVIAQDNDLWLKDFILGDLGYTDFLDTPGYERIRKVFYGDVNEFKYYFGKVDTVLGKVPIRVYQKPYSNFKSPIPRFLKAIEGRDLRQAV